MGANVRRLSCVIAAGALAAMLVAAVPAGASQADPGICKGTFASPGVLSGTHWSDVVIRGACVVNGGRTVIHGDLIVSPGSALVAAFANNDVTGTGASSLKVTGTVHVDRRAVAILGCEPGPFTCLDDPHKHHPTLASSDTILGNLSVIDALGVIVHNSSIRGWVKEAGGGGGLTCNPTKGSAFEAFGSPDYSDFEDNSIGRSLMITDVRSCWLGALRNDVWRSVHISRNSMADPDAMEIATNTVHGDMSCYANSPAVQFGDSFGMPNVVYGWAAGQCSFRVRRPDPAPNGPLGHISVHPND
jgi:hypothetical protein